MPALKVTILFLVCSANMSKYKASFSDNNNPNEDLCNLLIELANYEKNVNRNVYKHNAYRKAAGVLAEYPTKVQSGKEARKLPGVGEQISKKIDEFLTTGKLKQVENIHKDSKAEAINLLTRVSGIGPVKASSLASEGILTIEDLKKNTDKLTHHQIIGLKYFEDFEKKIPRQEIEDIEQVIIRELKETNPDYIITICGSYRRGKSESGDIDTLITHPYLSDNMDKTHTSNILKNIVTVLENCSLIIDIISLGETKFMGVCRLSSEKPARRLDIRLTPFDQYYCSILYFTGSDMFNKAMRAHALEKGFTLNEYTLRPVGCTGIPGEPLKIHSEEEIFEILDYPYKKPEERIG